MTDSRIVTPAQLRDSYRQITQRIAAAAERSGRPADSVAMIAVTKNATPDQIRTLVEQGHQDLGESRVQQLTQRVATLAEWLNRKRTLGAAASKAQDNAPPQVRWHMIGHLQRNKVKQVVPLVHMVHSVDSLRLAEELQNFAARTDRTLDVLLQVNASGEAAKHGLAPPAVIHMAEQIDTMMNLRLRGLMTMAPYTEKPEEVRHVFARTAELLEDMRRAKAGGPDCNLLSMGMSNDYEVAIEEGANVVRIGRALFGDAPEAAEE